METQAREEVELSLVPMRTIEVQIEGTSPILCNRFTDETLAVILDDQGKKAGKRGKVAKDPEKLVEASLYPLVPPRDGTHYGHPAEAFQAAMIQAARHIHGLSMQGCKGTFMTLGGPQDQLVPIVGADDFEVDIRRVRVGRGVVDIRCRARIPVGWTATVPVEFLAEVFSAEQLVNLLALAGGCVGIGDYRPLPGGPGNPGPFGRFRVTGIG